MKDKYMTINKIIFMSIIVIMLIQCKTIKSDLTDCDLLKKSTTSEEFQDFFRICSSNKEEIKVFNNTTHFKTCLFSINSDCGKTINLMKKEFELNVNSSKIEGKGIVLYNYFQTDKKKELYFLNTHNNGALIMEYNNSFELINTRKGAF